VKERLNRLFRQNYLKDSLFFGHTIKATTCWDHNFSSWGVYFLEEPHSWWHIARERLQGPQFSLLNYIGNQFVMHA